MITGLARIAVTVYTATGTTDGTGVMGYGTGATKYAYYADKVVHSSKVIDGIEYNAMVWFDGDISLTTRDKVAVAGVTMPVRHVAKKRLPNGTVALTAAYLWRGA